MKNEIPAAVVRAVDAALLARCYAETMRSAVDAIQREILRECPIKRDPCWSDRAAGGEPDSITDPRKVYMGMDHHVEDFYAECNKRARAAGIKPPQMPDDHCPALVAEDIQLKAELFLLDCAGEMLQEPDFADLTTRDMDNYHRIIELLCGMVVNMPGYRNPLTNK